MATKFGSVVTYGRKTPPAKSRDLLMITWLREEWKNIYMHFHNTSGHQARKWDFLLLQDTTH